MKLLTALYAVAIFLSAFLLFLIEPMMGKRLIPLLGGSAAVWTTCLVFFQFALLAGYLYAHRLVMRLPARMQGLTHMGLLAVAFVLFYLGSRANLHANTSSPVASVFWLLAFLVGAPFLALSATCPLLQAWYSASFARGGGKAAPPYHLFGLSNLGSLLALIVYPVFIEPRYSLHVQTFAWTVAFAAFVIACSGIALKHRGAAPIHPEPEQAGSADPPPGMLDKIFWLLLPACGSVLLCAVTNHITQNIAPIPLLWILPLIMYLLSFVLAFNPWGFYPRRVMFVVLAIALGATGYYLASIDTGLDVRKAVPLFCGVLLLACLFCHGELYRLRPAPRYATSFYLYIAAGGALGALFVGVLAPMIFNANYEFVCGLILITALAAAVTWKDRFSPRRLAFYICAGLCALALVLMIRSIPLLVLVSTAKLSIDPKLACGLVIVAALAVMVTWTRGIWQQAFWLACTMVMIALIFVRAHQYAENRVVQVRTFYGVLRVTREQDNDGSEIRHLLNGTIEHGKQFFGDDLHRVPTTYYAEDSGVGIALRFCCGDRPRRVGVIGLGAGTIAAYGRPGDVFRFYDINPQVEKIARTNFTYLSDSQALVQVVLGDARVSLTQEPPEKFDVLVIDAFSGDAIPVHLITTQALDLYRSHMRPGGIIAFHVSNRYLDLAPVLQQQADHVHLETAEIDTPDNDERGEYGADWVLVTDNQDFLTLPQIENVAVLIGVPRNLRLWTDDYNSLLPILRSSKDTSDE